MRLTDLFKDNPVLVLLVVEDGKYVEKPLIINSREYNKIGCMTRIFLKIDER